MVKTQSKGPGQPAPSKPEALDEKITHLTEEVARTATRYKVPILVTLVAVVAIVAVTSLISILSDQQESSWSDQIYLLFQQEPSQIRVDGPKLAEQLRGTRIEPAFIVQYASWRFNQGEPGDREEAIALLEQAKGRNPDSILIGLALGEFEQVANASEGFVLPPIPEPNVAPGGTAGLSPNFPGLGTAFPPPPVVTAPPESSRAPDPPPSSADGDESGEIDSGSGSGQDPEGGATVEPPAVGSGSEDSGSGGEDDANSGETRDPPVPATGDGEG